MARSGSISAALPSSWRAVLTGKAEGEQKAAASKVMTGSIIMLAGSTLVSGFNFLYNVAMAHMLGPARFGHVSAAVTILMLFSAVTLSFQLVCAKFVARNSSAYGQSKIYSVLLTRSWIIGIVLGAMLAFFAKPFSAYLHVPDPHILMVLALGIAFYIPLGVRRGRLQGLCMFTALTWNFVLEAVLKLGAALLLVWIGWGVVGAIGALAGSVIGAFLFLRGRNPGTLTAGKFESASLREGVQAIVFFIGQVLINNIDILMVKHFFDPTNAGVYAAVALAGRVLYFACWSVVSAMFPVSAGASNDESAWAVLRWPLLVVGGMSTCAVAIMAIFPHPIMQIVFGKGFDRVGGLLAIYAGLTGLYALAVTLITYEMSRKIANTAWVQLAFSGFVVLGIALFHSTLLDVALVQLVLMVVLLATVSLPFIRKMRRRTTAPAPVQEIA